MKSESCIMCDFAKQLYTDYLKNKDTDEGKEKLAQFKKIASTLRIYTPVLVRGEEDKGARWLGISKTVYTAILKNIKDAAESNIDILDLKKGRDLKLTAVSKEKNPPYGKTEIKLAFSDSPFVQAPYETDAIIESVPDIFEIYRFKSADDMKKALDTYLDPSVEYKSESDKGTVVDYSKNAQNDSEPEDPSKKKEDIEDDITSQFAELMGEKK